MATTTQTATRPLEAGDRLDRAEFHRRYLATPSIRKAELVEGIVIVPSPPGVAFHGEPYLGAGHWLMTYVLATPGVVGPPELVIEIAASSASYDLHAKRGAYERLGVQEYVVWRTRDDAIDWWALRDGRYAPLPASAEASSRARSCPAWRWTSRPCSAVTWPRGSPPFGHG